MSQSRQTTPGERDFLKDVATHEMTVLRDDGVHRHLTFRRPGTSCMSFDLLTWPGYLAYTGDMGCYVFTRLPDMFQFFRNDRASGDGTTLFINPQYWSEKCVASDRDGITRYSPDRFIEEVRRCAEEAPKEVRQLVERDLVPRAHDGEHEARRAAMDFDRMFDWFWEANLHDYTHRFRWCCYALVWGIQQYDKAKVTA